MPTPEPPRVVVLRAPGGEPWTDPRVRLSEILTGTVHDLGADPAVVARAVGEGRPLAATSPRAARWLAELPPSVPRGRLFVSGARTGRIAAEGGWDPVLPLEGSGGQAAARRLLTESVSSVPPLYVRGRETAGTFEAALEAAGAAFDCLEVYEIRERGSLEPSELEALGSADALAFLAPSCLRVLRRCAPALADALSRRLPALAGPTTASVLREAAWSDVREASEPTARALVDLLVLPPVSGDSP